MSTYAQERKTKDAAKARAAQRYAYAPAGCDIWDARTSLAPGAIVVKISPHGCPPNGTMGHCYVGAPDTGEFIGLVLLASLVKAPRA
jgi:hypothetical protein